MNPTPFGTPAPVIELDWKEYWLKFQDDHGGEPVPYKGRFLFRDGWTYSTSDYSGPEWPPPANPKHRKELELKYWEIRRSIVHNELTELTTNLEHLRRMQVVRKTKLQQTVRYRDDSGNFMTEARPLDTSVFEMRAEWLTADRADCDARIAKLKEEVAELIRIESQQRGEMV